MYLSIQLLQRDVVFDVDVIRKGVYNVSSADVNLEESFAFMSDAELFYSCTGQ